MSRHEQVETDTCRETEKERLRVRHSDRNIYM